MSGKIYSGGMVWFIGCVEDRMDPEEIGRVRVRCFGIHTDDKTHYLLKTYHLQV